MQMAKRHKFNLKNLVILYNLIMKLLKIIFFPITLVVMLIKNLIKSIQKSILVIFLKT